MRILSADYVTSAVRIEDFAYKAQPQFTFVGRSNAGKSTLLNSLTGRKSLARVSKTPGRTRMLNIFSVNNGEFYFVDIPGYGYAEGSGGGKSPEWQGLIDEYFSLGADIRRAFLLVDSRIAPTELDITAAKYLYQKMIPFTILAAKADKLSASARSTAVRRISEAFCVGRDNVLPVSGITGLNKEALISIMANDLRKE